MEACPLLPRLLPLTGQPGILGVALSGAGPSVLLVVDPGADIGRIANQIHAAAADPALEIVETAIGHAATISSPISD
jgi:homoserine kinase